MCACRETMCMHARSCVCMYLCMYETTFMHKCNFNPRVVMCIDSHVYREIAHVYTHITTPTNVHACYIPLHMYVHITIHVHY